MDIEVNGIVPGQTMLAAVTRSSSDRSFTLERIPVPQPKSGEALLRVSACGVCHSDLHVLKGEIDFPRPAVMGHELSGVVVSLGAETEGFELGDRVVGGFIMPCTTCARCTQGRDDICEVFFTENRLKGNLLDGTSRLVDGEGNRLNMYSAAGFAEYAVIPVSALAKVDDQVDLVTAAVLGCAGMTGYGAVVRGAGDVAGLSACVIAVGGVGLSITQVLASLGARQVIAVDVDERKLELAAQLGATHTINARNETNVIEAVQALSGGGVDVAFDALGSPLTLGQAMRVLGEGGRGVAVGLSASDSEVSVPINGLVRRGQSMQGSYGGRTRVDLPAVVSLAAEGALSVEKLVTNRYSLDHINEAYKDLADGKILGRGVVVFDEVA
ncbi:zinc-binding dehydrogenase [Leucobacter sp. W1038]|uniref:zinc-binding dehydrogenase n=1 Tax=Leucobacter sp. W1038 TaxID=3438281 RepID=UPI003D9683F4